MPHGAGATAHGAIIERRGGAAALAMPHASPSVTPSPALVRALWLVCLVLAGVGVLVAVAGGTAMFAAWRTAAAVALLDRPGFPAVLEPFAALTDGVLGGSIAGKWVAAAWLVRHPLAEGRRWASQTP